MISCSKQKQVEKTPFQYAEDEFILCDAETVENDSVFQTSLEKYKCSNAWNQSNDLAKSGDYSVKLDSQNQYGFGVKLENLRAGNFIRASVWQLAGDYNGTLIVALKGENSSYVSRTYYGKLNVEEDGWMKHNLSLIVNPGISEAEIYVFSGGKTTYFDDLQIERFNQIPENNYSESLELFINPKAKTKLLNSINDAATGPVILDKHKDYVKAQLLSEGKLSDIKLKLKGDWTDHLTSGKISCRIKIKGNSAYHQKKTFSIHHASTRNYIDEWIAHKIAEQEDVLTTTYEFTNVHVNGLNYGLYAVEEHFEKQLLESRNRREGPILKFDETGMWEMIYQQMKEGTTYNLPYFEACKVGVFKEKKVKGSASLLNGYLQGAKLLQLFKHGFINVGEIFDLEQMAKFHLIQDITAGSHASEWHNRRFYFNPVTQKLEHILYDVMPFDNGTAREFLHQRQFAEIRRTAEGSLDLPFILNEEYQAFYLYHLDRMTAPAYWDSVYTQNKNEISEIEAAIQIEEPDYNFDPERYSELASFLRATKSSLISQWEEVQTQYSSKEQWVKEKDFIQLPDSLVLAGVSLNAYVMSNGTKPGYLIKVENYHYDEIEICGYERENWKGHAEEMQTKINLLPFWVDGNETEFILDFKPNKLFFKVKNRSDRYFECKVSPFEKPKGISDRMELETRESWKQYCNYNSNRAVLKSETINELICFPKEIDVVMPAGTKIDFVEGGGMVILGSFMVEGTSSNPAEVISSDSISTGITVLNAKFVDVNHLKIDALSNLKYKSWELTGAFSVYETPTKISNLTITAAQCEDALNIIRSNFDIEFLSISRCASDAFDADFCTGTLSNASFKNTGNDCIDFSGSTVIIKNVEIINSGDKGISGGERSTLDLYNILIMGAVTGIAAKDQTVIHANRVRIKNAEYNLMAFQKKAEYGPAFLYVVDDDFSHTKDKIVVDVGSEIKVNQLLFKGESKIDVEKLYERF